MNINSKGKGDLIAYGCVDTTVAAILNDFVKVSWTGRKFILLILYDYLSKKYIMIVDDTTFIDLPTGNIISYLNDTSLLYGVFISLISASQSYDFDVDEHAIINPRGGKQYIYSG